MSLPDRASTILVAALGGEGGGVMADWLIEAAAECGFPASATSIPGVAQRTGATSYYLEIYPATRADLGNREPVMALAPHPDGVDLMVASELIEAGRALQNGFVTPGRTVLVASTHRIYATIEKMKGGDGRFDGNRVLEAAGRLANRAVLFDMRRIAQERGTVINAVLFGAMAGSGALPLPRAACEAAIRKAGRGVEASLRGFADGYAIAAGEKPAPQAEPGKPLATAPSDIIDLGLARLTDYQGPAYAALYRERVTSLGNVDAEVVAEVARQLALWMSYEDVVRVADLKTRPERFARVRREAGAKDSEPVVIVDYLKPGPEELASILPRPLGARVTAWAERRGKLDGSGLGLHVKTSSVLGYLLVRPLAWLKRLRPYSYRYAIEQALIERWLGLVRDAAARSTSLALEIARCASLLKGYGDTHRRGKATFLAILDGLVADQASTDPASQAAAIRAAREAALANPEAKPLVQLTRTRANISSPKART